MAYSDTAHTPGDAVTLVADTDTLIVAANPGRLELSICNDDATSDLYIKLAATGAAASEGIRVNKGGGSYTTTQYRGAVCGYSAAGGVVTFAEV